MTSSILFTRKLCRNFVTVSRMASSLVNSRQMKLEGKVAIVTASTSGIGFSIAQRLGEDGAKIVICSRKQENVDRAISELKKKDIDVIGVSCHVSKKNERLNLISKTLECFGSIDILVNNAGTNPQMGDIIETTTEENWDKIFDTNVKSGFFLTQEIVPHMEKHGGGSVIFMASITAFTPFHDIPVYSLSKTAVVGLTKVLSVACAKRNIRVNCIAPGIIETNFSQALWSNEKLSKSILSTVPLKRFGKAEDCSGAVAFLASDDSAYITGETIVISGGMTSRL